MQEINILVRTYSISYSTLECLKMVPVHWRTVLGWHHHRSPTLQVKHMKCSKSSENSHTKLCLCLGWPLYSYRWLLGMGRLHTLKSFFSITTSQPGSVCSATFPGADFWLFTASSACSSSPHLHETTEQVAQGLAADMDTSVWRCH